jgi:rod shape-determining protein MreC
MESVLGRYRNLTILVGVLFLQVLGLAVQVKRSADAENTRLIRIWAVGAITPFERGLVWTQNGSRNLWHNYFFLRGVRAENRALKEQIEQMRLEQVRLSEDATQAHRLQTLLTFKEQFIAKTVAAQVIGSSGSDLSRAIYIDKGSNDGIAADMAVITAGGIVGKVLRVYPSTSLILMINDQSSGVGALLEKSRLQGVLRGTSNGEVLLDRVMSDEQVAVGDTVLSSGGDQIFPKGLPVGSVSNVSPGKEMFLNIRVKPAADLSRLEEVLVVTEKQERQVVAVNPVKVRAADILAQRLPSVPDKPVDTGTGAGANAKGGVSAQSASAIAVKPQPEGVGKPETPKSSGAPTGSDAGNPGVGHNSAIAGTTVIRDASKKVVTKTQSGEPALNGNSQSPARSTAASGASPSGAKSVSTTPISAPPHPAAPPAKRPSQPTKPASAEPLPQPPAAEDSPH